MSTTAPISDGKLNTRGGVLAAILWGMFGALAAAVAVAGVGVFEGWLAMTELTKFGDGFRWYLDRASSPVFGTALLFACAGWVSGSARPSVGIGSPLILISMASIAAWYLIGISELLPRRLKGTEHPPIYFSELLAFVVPPVLAATVLTKAGRT